MGLGLGSGGLGSGMSVGQVLAALVGQTVTANKFLAGDGTSLAPSFSFANATGAGMFRSNTGYSLVGGLGTIVSDNSTGVSFNWNSVAVASLTSSGIALNCAGLTLSSNAGAVSWGALAGTAGSGTGITVNASALQQSAVHKITVTNAALTAAALTQDVTLWTLPAKTRVTRVIADVTTKFIGGGTTAASLVCGNSAGGTQYLLSGDIFTNPITLGDAQSELGAGIVGGTGFSSDTSWASAITLQARFTSVTANVNAFTQGSVTFYIEHTIYP